jgi:hypothetical protein
MEPSILVASSSIDLTNRQSRLSRRIGTAYARQLRVLQRLLMLRDVVSQAGHNQNYGFAGHGLFRRLQESAAALAIGREAVFLASVSSTLL